MANPTPDTVQMTQRGTFPRDDNDVPITNGGLQATKSITFTGDNTSGIAVPLFHITGTVQVTGLWGVVTTNLGSNHTAAYWRLNDQTAQVSITASSGTALSGIKAGSTIVKNDLASAALVLLNNSAGRVSEPTTLETMYFSPFVAMKKTAATTDIEYVYSTTNSPTTGVIQFFCQWLPVSQDGQVTPV
jgi:hypothetical protein